MPTPLSFGRVGAGRIGAVHADTLARRLPNARLTGTEPSVTGADARVALEIALSARESVETAAPVVLIGVLQ